MNAMRRRFNVAGPCFPEEHYMLPALDRLPGIRGLVEARQYFVVHAPRQSGKTTALQALVDEINAGGGRCAIYCTLETLQTARDVAKAMEAIRGLLLFNAENALPEVFAGSENPSSAREPGVAYAAESLAVRQVLSALCRRAGKPLVVFFDEADCLSGDVLVSFLRQLRDGYVNRNRIPFPVSIALVGMLDIRDYKAQIREDGESLGQTSPFNIISADLMLRNFTEGEVGALYSQHTEETGQVFSPGVLEKVWEFTRGQPWLVNALARECIDIIHDSDFSAPITVEDVVAAKETIIRRRDTHVDSLMERLREPRVRRVVEPILSGEERTVSADDPDHRFVLDLGLLREENGALVPANRMYAEIIGRYLTRDEQMRIQQAVPQTPWATADGLDMSGLMAAFQAFWREHSGSDRTIYDYKEATPHLTLMAFLQRVVNGGGRIVREMAAGSKRLDLYVEYRGRRYAVEVKLKKRFSDASFVQLAEYLDTLGLSEGWMAVFDSDSSTPWSNRLYTRSVRFSGKTIHVVGL